MSDLSDLISKSALKKYMRDYKWEFVRNDDFAKAIEMVDVQPRIEAVPVEQIEQMIIDRLSEHDKELRNRVVDEVLEVVTGLFHNFCGYDLEEMTKYGNVTAEQRSQSYSTVMMYEVAGEFDNLIDSIEDIKIKGEVK